MDDHECKAGILVGKMTWWAGGQRQEGSIVEEVVEDASSGQISCRYTPDRPDTSRSTSKPATGGTQRSLGLAIRIPPEQTPSLTQSGSQTLIAIGYEFGNLTTFNMKEEEM